MICAVVALNREQVQRAVLGDAGEHASSQTAPVARADSAANVGSAISKQSWTFAPFFENASWLPR